MATTASPYGLRAVNELGGLPYAGSTRTFLIDPAGTTGSIFNGTVVGIDSNGYIKAVDTTGEDGTTNALNAVGVFVGCSYVNAQGQQIWSQYYPTGVTGVITASVIDDDRAVFQVQAAGVISQNELGKNVYFSSASQTGSTTTGNSNNAVVAVSVATAAAFKIIGFASGPGDAYTDVLVKFNPGQHVYNTATYTAV
jgi:hypothetical protein